MNTIYIERPLHNNLLKIFLILFLVLISQYHVVAVSSHPDSDQDDYQTSPYRHNLNLDGKGKYLLEWIVDWDKNRTVFSVTVETLGYVGLGLSKDGKMDGADIVMGGVLPNGKPYFNDRHGIGNQPPIKDQRQDWILHKAKENSSHTFLIFSRPFETCDDSNDLLINDHAIVLIWAYGETDSEFEYHHQNRGGQPIYLLDPELTPTNVISFQMTPEEELTNKDVQIWKIKDTQLIPAKATTYLCSIYRFTSYNGKRHIIGYNPVLPTEVEMRHTHHFILFRCNLPEGQSPEVVFEPVMGLKEECYNLQIPLGRIPTGHCVEQLYVWAVGDRAHFLPPHVGIPVTETGTDYFMFQIHFDNPNELPGMTANYGLEIFTTDKLREHDSGIIFSGKLFPASPGIMIPPSSLGHAIYGHCGSECTKLMIPTEGIRAYAVHPHTHIRGKSVRLIHIRNGRELPYILDDENYFPTYQSTRMFRDERIILPGDQLIMRCVYANPATNGSVTVGGFPAVDEMCVASIYYYNKIPNRGICGSEMRSDEYREFLQIYNTTWSDELLEMVVTSPSENAGLTVPQAGNRIKWTIRNRKKLEDLHRYLPQITACPPLVQPVPRQSRVEDETGRDLNNVKVQFVQKRIKCLDDRLKRNIKEKHQLSANFYEKEISFPEFEFVSVYEKNVIEYRPPTGNCYSNKNRFILS